MGQPYANTHRVSKNKVSDDWVYLTSISYNVKKREAQNQQNMVIAKQYKGQDLGMVRERESWKGSDRGSRGPL